MLRSMRWPADELSMRGHKMVPLLRDSCDVNSHSFGSGGKEPDGGNCTRRSGEVGEEEVVELLEE